MTPEKPQKKRWKFVYSIRRDGVFLEFRTVRADTIEEFAEKVNADIRAIKEMQG